MVKSVKPINLTAHCRQIFVTTTDMLRCNFCQSLSAHQHLMDFPVLCSSSVQYNTMCFQLSLLSTSAAGKWKLLSYSLLNVFC